MFRRKKQQTEAPPAVHTLLRSGTIWKGDIHAGPHSLRIECLVEGTIHSEGEVTIAPSGIVKGTIHAKHLIVSGRAKGTFKITDCLEIQSTGWVDGDTEMGALLVDEGGTLEGSCILLGTPRIKKEPVVQAKQSKKGRRTSAGLPGPRAEAPSRPFTPFWDLANRELQDPVQAEAPSLVG